LNKRNYADFNLERMYFAADLKWLGPAASAQRPGFQLLFAPFMGLP